MSAGAITILVSSSNNLTNPSNVGYIIGIIGITLIGIILLFKLKRKEAKK